MDREDGYVVNGLGEIVRHPSIEHQHKNAAAIAWVEQWYATPDDQPPGYWDELEAEMKRHPIHFGDKDFDWECAL